MTKAAGVTKVRTEGNFVWYKKSELDTLFDKCLNMKARSTTPRVSDDSDFFNSQR